MQRIVTNHSRWNNSIRALSLLVKTIFIVTPSSENIYFWLNPFAIMRQIDRKSNFKHKFYSHNLHKIPFSFGLELKHHYRIFNNKKIPTICVSVVCAFSVNKSMYLYSINSSILSLIYFVAKNRNFWIICFWDFWFFCHFKIALKIRTHLVLKFRKWKILQTFRSVSTCKRHEIS